MVSTDIHGDLYGHELVAEWIAQHIESKNQEIARLRTVLAQFADESNWRANEIFDANSGNFRGISLAQDALK